MKIWSQQDILSNDNLKEQIKFELLRGKLIIYPTDTVYGLGCDATNDNAVKKLRLLKKTEQPLSVIPPTLDWIFENCHVLHRELLKKLPGKVTYIMDKKDPDFLKAAAPHESVGVRIPDHDFTRLLQTTGVPIISTSANPHGERVPATIQKLHPDLYVDYIVDGGELSLIPSEVWDLREKKAKKLR